MNIEEKKRAVVHPITEKKKKNTSNIACPIRGSNIRFTVTQKGNQSKHLFAQTVKFNNHSGNTIVSPINSSINLMKDSIIYVNCFAAKHVADQLQDCYITIGGIDYKCIIYTQEEHNGLWGDMYGRWGKFQYLSDDLPIMDRSKIVMSIAYLLPSFPEWTEVMIDTTSIGYTLEKVKSFASISNDRTGLIEDLKRRMSSLPMFNTFTDGVTKSYVYTGYYPNTFIQGHLINIGNMPGYDYISEEEEPDCSGIITDVGS